MAQRIVFTCDCCKKDVNTTRVEIIQERTGTLDLCNACLSKFRDLLKEFLK